MESHPADRWVQAALDRVNELYKDERYGAVDGDEHRENNKDKDEKDKKMTGEQ